MRRSEVASARAQCRSCPVRSDCLADALIHDERWGVWGGLTRPERKRALEEAQGSVRRVLARLAAGGLEEEVVRL